MKAFCFLLLITFGHVGFSQIKPMEILLVDSVQNSPIVASSEIDNANNIKGLVEKKDGKIDLLIEDYTENKKYFGYRIQIFSSSNNRMEAVKAKSEFIRLHPEIKSHLDYQAPNYKVRVGDYLDRLEANRMLIEIRKDFPSAFLVKGEVDPKVE